MKQFQVLLNNEIEHVIALPDNEFASIQINNGPTTESSKEEPSLSISGGRWKEQEFFSLEWQQRKLNLGDSILITYCDSSNKPTNILKCEKYVKPEERCSFCRKKKTEVEVLIQASIFAFICNECVFVCLETVNNFKKT